MLHRGNFCVVFRSEIGLSLGSPCWPEPQSHLTLVSQMLTTGEPLCLTGGDTERLWSTKHCPHQLNSAASSFNLTEPVRATELLVPASHLPPSMLALRVASPPSVGLFTDSHLITVPSVTSPVSSPQTPRRGLTDEYYASLLEGGSTVM